jgi:hypothetical protein
MLGFWLTCVVKMISLCHCWGWQSHQTASHIHTTHMQSGFWLTCWVKMMSLRHGWDWQPHQTVSCVHIRQMQSVWEHWYAVHGHMAVVSNSYTHLSWVRFWGFCSLVESKWCHCVMVEADSQLKLLPVSTLATYNVFLSSLICCPWAYVSSLKQLYPHYLVQILVFWLTCGVKMMSLCHGWGWQPHQTASCISILDIYKVFEHIDRLSMGIWQ